MSRLELGADDAGKGLAMPTVRVPINGSTLRWARNLSHMTEEELGRAAGISANRIIEIEDGAEGPTYVQTRKMAKKLDRPAAFFLIPPPATADIPVTADFRGRGDEMPSLLAREIKRAEAHRRTLDDLEGIASPPPLPSQVSWQSIIENATAARHALGIEISTVPHTALGNPSFNYWRGLLERAGLVIFQTTGIGLDTYRGLSIHHETRPIILLNGADSAGGKIFTLFHEMAHLVNRTSGLCLLEERNTDEALCNAFAAEFLMPTSEIQRIASGPEPSDEVTRVAHHFRVSKLAAAIKLKSMNRLTEAELEIVRSESDAEWQRNRERLAESDGVPPQWSLRLRDLGQSYTSSVFRALENQRISMLDATYLLDAKVPTIEKMMRGFHRPGENR
jgi:Zn-dependent peptidase ImmA (M78 family)/transcriptional regulator with XRE-family HTH domain